jgi:lathosterol oxidase
MVVLHDAYFYWTHRMMHHPRLFHAVHQMHHRSFAPTPWATYAFTTPEAFIQAGALLFIVMIIPVHPVAVGIWFFGQTFYNAVILHSGHENYPRWFIRTPAARALTSATHHSVHHEKSHGNFGLYFNLWDSLLDTNHADYAQRFEKAKSRRVATRR